MRNSLLWKLLAVNAVVIAMVILIVWLAIDYLAADYFSAIMERYNISPADSHQMFLDSIHRFLVQGSLLALAVAVLLSFLLTRRVLAPLSQMTVVSRRIAAGDYSARVETSARDEVGQLAQAFNQMSDSLERVERLRRSMATDLAHELRTPLTNIRGYLEALADGVVPPSKDTFDMLQEEILRLVRLVEDLNQLTKADAAKAFLRKEEIELGDLMARVVQLYQYQFDNREIAVETSIGDRAAHVRGDRDKLLLVLRNLVQNAAQYATPGGRVKISAARVGDGVEVSFVNPATGIEKQDLDLIFERFHRTEKSRSRDSGGAGIGLSIVKELIEAHGGRIGAGSQGGEVRIWFTLPA